MDHPPSAPPLHNQQQQQQKIASSALKPHLKVEREILPKPSSLTSLNAAPSTTSSTTNPQPTKKRPITMVSGSGAHVAKRNLAPSASPDLHSSDKHSDSLFKSITTDILPKPLPNAPVASLSSPTIINSVTSTTANGTAKTTIGKASNSSKGTTNKVGQKKPLAPTAPTITKKKPSKSKYISKKAALVMKDQKDATSSLASSSNSPTSITKNETLPNTDNNIANSNHHLVNYSRPSPPPLSSHISHDFADSPSNPYRPRPVRSCTHCRQQKIRCNALETFPAPCTRCSKMDRKCVVDPFFKPQKGGQVQSLRDDISSLKQQLAALQRKNSTFSSDMESSVSPTAAHDSGPGTVGSGISEELTDRQQHVNSSHLHDNMFNVSAHQRSIANLIGTDAKSTRSSDYSSASTSPSSSTTGSTTVHNASIEAQNYSPNIDSNSRVLFGDSLPNKQQILHLHKKKQQQQQSPHQPKNHFSEPMISQSTPPIASHEGAETARSPSSYIDTNRPGDKIPEDHIHSRQTSTAAASPGNSDYIMGDVRLPFDKAEELHKRFMTQYLPFLPIIQSNSAAELYRQSQLLFWTVCLTASLSEPVPDLYNSLCSLIKQLAIETCWIQTPRSTHIVQALLILGNWPLPNEKVLDDCSYRFITLAKSLAMQLGLHRGKFIYEFSRTQVSLPDAEKWRTRTWIAIFIAEQVWCANLGLPPNMPMDYLLEESRTDASLPKPFRSLACLAIFCSKLVNLLGASVTSPDGTLEPKNRFSTLGILEQELDRLVAEMGTEDVSVEIYYLYLKMMICVFSFLPETPIQDQTIYIIKAYHAATRVVTLFSSLAEQRRIIEYPIYIRQPVSLAAFILFRLHLSPLLLPQYVESSRQSVVTVHRLFRNMLTAWKDVENDISRTAKVLEKLNFVIISHPELFTKAPGIITRMRSHLTASLFYELIWAIHEARRRGGIGSSSTNAAAFVAAAAAAAAKKNNNVASNGKSNQQQQPINNSINSIPGSHVDSVPPLPFFNQITKDDFTATTTTTPNGTTITTLVPTHNAPTMNTTPLAGIGNPSTMLVAATGPDVAGLNFVNMTESYSANNNLNGNAPVDIRTPKVTQQRQVNQQQHPPPFPAQQPASAFYDTTGSSTDPVHLDTLMQGMDWMDSQSGDDLLGWMDNMDFTV